MMEKDIFLFDEILFLKVKEEPSKKEVCLTEEVIQKVTN